MAKRKKGLIKGIFISRSGSRRGGEHLPKDGCCFPRGYLIDSSGLYFFRWRILGWLGNWYDGGVIIQGPKCVIGIMKDVAAEWVSSQFYLIRFGFLWIRTPNTLWKRLIKNYYEVAWNKKHLKGVLLLSYIYKLICILLVCNLQYNLFSHFLFSPLDKNMN